jgi:tetratricopeptide (TPR) repeat protein
LDLRNLPGLFGNSRRNGLERFFLSFFERQQFPTKHHMLGLFHYYRQELPKARTRFAKAICAAQGDYFEHYINLGAVLFNMGEWDAARQCYDIVLREHPGHPTATRRLSQIEQKIRSQSHK